MTSSPLLNNALPLSKHIYIVNIKIVITTSLLIDIYPLLLHLNT